MPEQTVGFDVDRDRVQVRIIDETQGRRWELLHVFRAPTDDEWLAYHRQATAVTVKDGHVVNADPKHAELALWELLVESVDDQYRSGNAPVMQRPDWKTRIPAAHKYLAIRVLTGQHAQAVDGPLA